MFGNPCIYTVHINPAEERPWESPRFVREGFNLWAFAFGAFWAFYHRLWLVALVYIAAEVGLQAVAEEMGLHPLSLAALQLGMQLIFGFLADELLRQKYRAEGYIIGDIVTGASPVAAQQRYFERVLQAT